MSEDHKPTLPAAEAPKAQSVLPQPRPNLPSPAEPSSDDIFRALFCPTDVHRFGN